MDIAGVSTLVTGGASGLGLATVRKLRGGPRLVFCGARASVPNWS
jgi:NAD(P)-dependent dehydrogenase (short-subunit alcohol dehydrogenase family)